MVNPIAFYPGTYYVLVFAPEGDFSTDHYRLQVETKPLPILDCKWEPKNVDPPQPAVPYMFDDGEGDDPWTLILYNKTRLDQAYGVDEGNEIQDALEDLADDPTVRGYVVPVDSYSDVVSRTYVNWSTSPNYCNVISANAVADAIRNEVISPVLEAHPTITYVVLVGSDEQIPFRRVPDITPIANEYYYRSRLEVEEMSALDAAFRQAYVLTDDFYGTPPGEELYCFRYLWLPSLAVGRLVETPDEIVGLVNGYITSNTLTATTALATGYDFFTDCAEAISNTFVGQDLDTSALISENWERDELRDAWSDDPPDLAAIGAHFEHWRGLEDKSVPFTNTEIVNASGDFSGTLNFSIGCHSGLNVPDDEVTGTMQTSPDIPQALAQRGAYWVGNTGYGYGMDDAIEASESLMLEFARELGQPPRPVAAGQAFVRAKQNYLGKLSSGGLTVFHEKALIESTFYGLPMYHVHVPSDTKESPASTYTWGEWEAAGGGEGLNSITVTAHFTMTPNDVDCGEFFDIDGVVQGLPGRPVQPSTSRSFSSTQVPHGAILVGGEFTDTQGFDPCVTYFQTPTHRLKTTYEPEFNAPGWFPLEPFAVNRFGDEYRLVIVGGQFNGEGNVERLYSELSFVVFSSDSDDYVPPAVLMITAERVDDTWEFEIWVTDDLDGTGVYTVAVTYEGDSWNTMWLEDPDADDHWTGTLNGDEDGELVFFVQAADRAGNATLVTNGGHFFMLSAQGTPVGGATEWAVWKAVSGRVEDVRMPFLPMVLRDY